MTFTSNAANLVATLIEDDDGNGPDSDEDVFVCRRGTFREVFRVSVNDSDIGGNASSRNSDVNADGSVDISDALWLIYYKLGLGPPPPLLECGSDPSPDGLDCEWFMPSPGAR